MDELIKEYIFQQCSVIGNTVTFDGKMVYYDVLKKHLSDLFNISELEIDVFMKTCFHDMDRNFDYSMFMICIKPKTMTTYDGRPIDIGHIYDYNGIYYIRNSIISVLLNMVYIIMVHIMLV
jgi:hypothetical protein